MPETLSIVETVPLSGMSSRLGVLKHDNKNVPYSEESLPRNLSRDHPEKFPTRET